mgnify:CR=1 FL=1
MSLGDLETLDKSFKLRRPEYSDEVFAKSNIIFIGDLHQMTPIKGDAIYKKYHALWHGSINTAIFLDNNHRFNCDLNWGDILYRMYCGKSTRDDINVINSRIINK